MQSITKKPSPFLRDTAVATLASTGVNVLNFAFIFLLAHVLSKDHFGRFTALLSIVSGVSVLAASMQISVTQSVASAAESLKRVYSNSVNLWYLVAVGLALLLPPVMYLAIGSPFTEGAVLSFAITSVFLSCLAFGAALGQRQIVLQSVANLLASIAKMLFVFLIILRPTPAAALFVWLSGPILVFWWLSKRILLPIELKPGEWRKLRLGETFLPTLFSRSTLFVLITSVPLFFDTFLVQAYRPELSGDYGAVSNIAKLTYFAASPILTALFPYLLSSRDSQPSLRWYFIRGAAIAFSAALACCLALSLLGESVVSLLLPPAYRHDSIYLGLYSVSTILFVLTSALVILTLAREQKPRLGMHLLPLVLQLAVFRLHNSEILMLVWNQIAVCAVQLAIISMPARRLLSPNGKTPV